MNPRDLFTKRSSSFSLEVFEQIEVGDGISRAVELLGDPVSIRQTSACEGCKVYLFMGQYPDWVFGGTECWYVVNSDDIVVERVKVLEP
jgi:hypothetical protein